MKNQQIKLTPKQTRIMESLNTIFDIHELKPVYMGEIKEAIVVEQEIVDSAWYHRTMDALEKLGLIQIVDSSIEVKQGPYKGKLIPVKAYELTELGKQYLGIDENIVETPVESNISNIKLCNAAINLIDELQEKHLNYVKRITWEMVKRHIVSTLEQAQEIIGHLYKSGTIQETERVYNSDSLKIFVAVVPTIVNERFEY